MASAAHDDHTVPYDADGGEYRHGDMEIIEQRSTYDLFMGLSKWGSLTVAAVVIWGTVAFAVGAGPLTAFLVVAVFIALGVFLLREKKKPGVERGH